MFTLLRRMRKKSLKICHFKESETVQREKTRTCQKPEGVPALPASRSARAETRSQRLRLARTVESGPYGLARSQTGTLLWPCQVHGRSRDEKYKKDRLQLWRRIFGNATSEGIEDFVAQFMATSSESSSSAAASVLLELHRLQQGRQV